MNREIKKRKSPRLAVIGILVFFLLVAVFNTANKTHVAANMSEEIRNAAVEWNIGSR